MFLKMKQHCVEADDASYRRAMAACARVNDWMQVIAVCLFFCLFKQATSCRCFFPQHLALVLPYIQQHKMSFG